MYYGSGTVDINASGQLADAATYASGRSCVLTPSPHMAAL